MVVARGNVRASEPTTPNFMANKIRVTELMKEAGLIDTGHYTAESAWKGSVIHKACELLSHGKLDWSSVHQDLVGYVKSLETWYWLSLLKVYRTEAALSSDVDGLVGHADLIGKVGRHDVLWVIDFKSGGKLASHRIQTAFYKYLALKEGICVQKRAALYLHKNGRMATLDPHEDYNDEVYAQSILTAHNLADNPSLVNDENRYRYEQAVKLANEAKGIYGG